MWPTKENFRETYTVFRSIGRGNDSTNSGESLFIEQIICSQREFTLKLVL